MRILYLGAHAILEYDELRLFHELGHEVFSVGAYINPGRPMEDKRPPLAIPEQPALVAAVDALGQQGYDDTLDAAKRRLPDPLVEWADVIIIAALERQWLIPQWPRLRHKRVVWRTIGQSGDGNEAAMAPLRAEGCQIVRYSPRERHIPGYAGEDAVIRFYKDPAEWTGWNGHVAVVTNVTQHMLKRDPWCNPRFWFEATRGLPVRPMGAGSELIGGTGDLPLEQMQHGLRNARAYLAVGTQPASYTLGFIEAGMTGVPIVSIGPSWMRILPYGPLLYEQHELAHAAFEDPAAARRYLRQLLVDHGAARTISDLQRQRFVARFGRAVIAAQWQAFLAGDQVMQPELEAVAG